jgi:cytochrome c oxidase subunit 4
MPMQNQKNHIIPYKTLLLVLGVLIILTVTSVIVTQISLGTFTVLVALLIAAVKSTFVLRIFMHLKFESKMFSVAVLGVIALISVVIVITLLDYLNR